MPLISGGGGGGGAAFNGGTITDRLTVAPATDTEPLIVVGLAAGTSGLIEVDSHTGADVFDINSHGGITIAPDDAGVQALTVQGKGGDATATAIFDVSNTTGSAEMQFSGPNGLKLFSSPIQAGGAALNPITSGALPPVAPSSGVAFQCSTTRDVCLVVPFTGDATNNAATLKIELSPDNVTFSILDTLSIAAALNLTGAINTPVTIAVPAGWRVKLTAVHGTIGTATYY